MSNKLNYLELYSLVASVLTLLTGQVFYAATASPLVARFLTILVLVMLALNGLVVVSIIYYEWRPAEDPHLEFERAFKGDVSNLLYINYNREMTSSPWRI